MFIHPSRHARRADPTRHQQQQQEEEEEEESVVQCLQVAGQSHMMLEHQKYQSMSCPWST